MMDGARAKLGTNVAISVIGALAILIMINYLSSRHWVRGDWTSSKVYSLSSKTEKTVARIQDPLRIIVLWSKGDPYFSLLKGTVDNYQSLSNKIATQYIDPDTHPEEYSLIYQQYGRVMVNHLGQQAMEFGIIVIYGDNTVYIPYDKMQQYEGEMFSQSGEMPVSNFLAEQEITSAIINVTAHKKTTLCFTQGHGEMEFDGSDPYSLRHIKQSLKLDGYLYEPFVVSGASQVPKQCSVVVAARPTQPFLEQEQLLLTKYLNKGGRLLLFLDPSIKDGRFLPSGLEALTAQNGIQLKNEIIFETDPRRLVTGNEITFMIHEFFNHESVKPLYGPTVRPVIVALARPLAQVDADNAISDVLAKSSPMSWGETDLDTLGVGESAPTQGSYEKSGPLTIAMAARRNTSDKNREGRLIVVGDSDFLNEELFINAAFFNRDFWSSLVGWVTERPDMVTIAPKNPKEIQLMLSERDFIDILISLVAKLLFIIFLGVYVVYQRRK